MYIYWVFLVSVYSVTLCLHVLCVLYKDVHPLVQVNKVSVLFCCLVYDNNMFTGY